MSEEEWRDIPGFDGYQASTLGNIRRGRDSATLRSRDNGWGYLHVSVKRTGETRARRVAAHRLVAFAFIPNPDALRDVNHKDLDKTNNRPENLEWLSHRDNQKHASAAKLYCPAHNPKRRHKLAPAQVLEVKRLCDAGDMTIPAIAKAFGVSTAQVGRIKRGTQWKHLFQAALQGARIS